MEFKETGDAKRCPKCGEYEYRFTPDIGWYCSKCGYRADE
jgi:ribosomal protein L37AE/L43A